MLMLILMIVYNYLYSELLQYHSLYLFCNTYTYYYVPNFNVMHPYYLMVYPVFNTIS